MAPWMASGLVYASGIALCAGSITLLYMSTRTFNFAAASLATIGFYVVYTGIQSLGGVPYYYYPFSFIVGALLGVICYYGLNRPLLKRGAVEITLMMSTLGYDLILLSFVQMYADYLTSAYKWFPRRVTLNHIDLDFQIFGARPSATLLPLIAIACLIILHLFLTRTKFGISMRATIENPILAGASGINSDRVYLVAWVIGGGMCSLGGAFIAQAQTGHPFMGATIIPLMFAGAILGGLHNLYGGILGGLVIGMTEYAGVFYLSQQFGPWVQGYRMGIPLLVMAITLIAFPRGLSGIPLKKYLDRMVDRKRGVSA